MQCWHIPFYSNFRDYLPWRFKGQLSFVFKNATQNDPELTEEKASAKRPAPKAKKESIEIEIPKIYLEQLRICRYAQNTINVYVSCFKRFLYFYKGHKPEEITQEQMRRYFYHLVENENVSESYQKQAINALNLYYNKILGRQTPVLTSLRKDKSIFSKTAVLFPFLMVSARVVHGKSPTLVPAVR